MVIIRHQYFYLVIIELFFYFARNFFKVRSGWFYFVFYDKINNCFNYYFSSRIVNRISIADCSFDIVSSRVLIQNQIKVLK